MQESTYSVMAWLAGIGALIGLGQLLQSKENITWKLAFGRAIVSAGLGASSGIVLLWVPNAPTVALLGLAAGLASLGTSAIEKILRRYIARG